MSDPQSLHRRSDVVSVASAAEALADVLVSYDVPTRRIVREWRSLVADPVYAGTPSVYLAALQRIAFHEPQDDECAEAMRLIARGALNA